MLSKTFLKRLLFIAVVVEVGISSIIIFFALQSSVHVSYNNSQLSVSSQLPQTIINSEPADYSQKVFFSEQTRPGVPASLKIPKINVSTTLERVGVTADGAIDIPKNQDDVAWFDLGARPGENGSAIITGHYGWKNKRSSAFDNLYKLRMGDKIYITDDRGATFSFVIRETRRYDPHMIAADVFNSKDGGSHLNLITCDGEWNDDTKNYSTRLVVFADKE